MTGFFSDMPASIEIFNPPETRINGTYPFYFDENSQLHSPDDEPSHSDFIEKGRRIIYWHTHGVPIRKNGLAPVVIASEDSYSTHDKDKQLQSFNDMPSSIVKTEAIRVYFHLKWHSKGVLHRGGDKPASIIVYSNGDIEEEYFINGVSHRGNNLPANVRTYQKLWNVAGHIHNPQGAALINSYISKGEVKFWGLYGVELNENSFNLIVQTREETQLPLWVAFLYVMKFFPKDALTLFTEMQTENDAVIPMQWILRTAGVTNDTFRKTIMRAKAISPIIQFDAKDENGKSRLDALIHIVKFEEENLSLFGSREFFENA